MTEQEKFLALARERFNIAAKAESAVRTSMLDALRFRAGEQWPDAIRRERDADGRPCLTIDRTRQFISQVVNEIRQNKPAPKVRPVDDNADVKTAEVFQGIIRHIERQSKADAVRSWAAEYAVSVGRGFYRVVTDYADDTSFDQEIYLKRIKNPFTVHCDPFAVEPDYSDMQWCFIRTLMSKKEYEAAFPGKAAIGATFWETLGDTANQWVDADGIYVAEYFYVDTEQREVPHPTIEGRTRKVEVRKVKRVLMSGVEVLDEQDWPGRWIPVIPVLGEELDVQGETKLTGMVHRLMDAQRQYNYMRSAQVEAIALAPRAPFVGYAGQFEGHEDQWAAANRKNFPYLEVQPVTVNGQPAPLPQRQVFEPAIQAITVAMQWSTEDMKSSVGIHDASLGAHSNERSGKAILARQREGDIANYHFTDNLGTSINHEFRILVDLIPKIYDRPGRIVRILGEDEVEKSVALGPQQAVEVIPQGVENIYDLTVGKYDVAVTVGPSYSTKRQESAEALLQLAQTNPAMMQIVGDLIVKNLDIPGAEQISERLKKTLPPGLNEDEQQMPVPPQAQAKIAQYEQMIDALTQQLNGLADEQKSQKLQVESRTAVEMERIAMERERNERDYQLAVEKLKIDAAKVENQAAIEQLWAEIEVLKGKQQAEQTAIEAENDREFQREQNTEDRVFQAEQAERAAQTSKKETE